MCVLLGTTVPWSQLGDVLAQYLNIGAEDLVLSKELGQINIIFNIPHPLLLLHIHDKQPIRNVFLLRK
jgi:hypothetical protein